MEDMRKRVMLTKKGMLEEQMEEIKEMLKKYNSLYLQEELKRIEDKLREV